ncbi:MAG: terminase family protein [Bryobacteraceae bacterium]|nr:terminase family protein [Bryobacteraceae bacterium]
MTPQQHLRFATDPVAFATELLGFHPDPIQATVLTSDATRGIICCSRQWGKSTTTALKAAHLAYFRPNTDVLVAGPTGRQSGELVRKATFFLSRLGIRDRGDGLNSISQLLPNGSRIIGLPGKNEGNICGYSAPALILIDEARHVKDALYYSLLPMLATCNGSLWMISTPGGKQGFFYEEWVNQNNGFTRIKVTARECPRIPSAFLDAEYRRVPSRSFEQEYMCVFHGVEDALFSEEDLAAALDPSVEPFNIGPYKEAWFR